VLVWADDDYDIGDPRKPHRLHNVLDHRFISDGKELFWDGVSEGAEPGAAACGRY